MAQNKTVDKREDWRFIGDNYPQLEIFGPYANQYRVFIQDCDGDVIGLLPAEAKRLVARLEKAIAIIAGLRKVKHENESLKKAG